MHNPQNSIADDEIDLRELVVTLWAHKLFIVCACAAGIILGGYHALNVDKKFQSSAIFKLDDETSNSLSLGGQLGAFASLAGFGSGSSAVAVPTDQVMGRIFIQELDVKLNFQADPYFNTYNPLSPVSVDPIWKALIKRAIGWRKSISDPQEIIWQGIISKYFQSVEIDTTPDGSLKIIVTHEKPQRAAEIANTIMEEIIYSAKIKKNTVQDEQLTYLSSTLAKALGDLEISQSNLKEFALDNSALPLESFAARSLQLDALRDQLSRTSELHEAVSALAVMLKNKVTDQDNYQALRQEFPIVDQVEFRRVLGQNEIINSWSWPEVGSVDAVTETLLERKSRLQSQILVAQIDAERSGLALETYAKLEREAKVAEATYTVLIEQVKAQSMSAGYRPDRTEIFEYASVAINPIAPRRSLILALGAVLGLFIGASLSLILAVRRGVYYSTNALKLGAQARFTASSKTLLSLRNKSLSDVGSLLKRKPRAVLRDLAVEIHKSDANIVIMTSSRSKLSGIGAARSLSSYMQSKSLKIALIDFSSNVKKPNIDDERLSVESFFVDEHSDHVSVLKPHGELVAMELLSQKNFWESIQSLTAKFDLVFLCADNADAISLLSAAEAQNSFHITIARTKNTKSAALAEIRSRLPIQGLLHD
jgi:capsular polysaccharide biosynthesis protein